MNQQNISIDNQSHNWDECIKNLLQYFHSLKNKLCFVDDYDICFDPPPDLDPRILLFQIKFFDLKEAVISEFIGEIHHEYHLWDFHYYKEGFRILLENFLADQVIPFIWKPIQIYSQDHDM